jgi:methionine aminopeptidase
MQTAADIVHHVMVKLIDLCVVGAKVMDICIAGDKLVEEATAGVYNKSVKGVKISKGASEWTAEQLNLSFFLPASSDPGVAFPTCVSVNNAVAHFSPLAYVPTHAILRDPDLPHPS